MNREQIEEIANNPKPGVLITLDSIRELARMALNSIPRKFDAEDETISTCWLHVIWTGEGIYLAFWNGTYWINERQGEEIKGKITDIFEIPRRITPIPEAGEEK